MVAARQKCLKSLEIFCVWFLSIDKATCNSQGENSDFVAFSDTLFTYLCLKLDLVEPAPEVLRQVVLTNSLDWAGWEMGGQAVGAQLLGPGVLV